MVEEKKDYFSDKIGRTYKKQSETDKKKKVRQIKKKVETDKKEGRDR